MKNIPVSTSLYDECVASISQLVRIPSVCDEENSAAGMPFGPEIARALRETLEICRSIGMKIFIDPDGYYGYADYGDQEDTFGILCHLDVVPAGDLTLWNTAPFSPELRGGRLYGRGTQDDKGPAMVALFALKALIDAGCTFTKKIRFIFGTDEETLWRCMAAYGKKEKYPTMGFAPDASFPLIFAEKGLLQVQLKGKGSAELALNCGDAFNVVPSKAIYDGKDFHDVEFHLEESGFKFQKHQNATEVVGKSCHAKNPEDGINAVSRLAIALDKMGKKNDAVQFIANEIGEDAFASKIFGVVEDDVSGKLKCNVGKLQVNENETVLSIDMRIPVTADKNEVCQKLTATAKKYNLTFEEFDYLASIYVPLESELVTNLLTVYQEVSGDYDTKPISSGGATYARAMNNCVAFGMLFPNSVKTEHQPNEYLQIADLKKAMDIYVEAIYRLCCKENA